MTEASAPNPRRTPKEVSSNPLLRTTLIWSAVVTAGPGVACPMAAPVTSRVPSNQAALEFRAIASPPHLRAPAHRR